MVESRVVPRTLSGMSLPADARITRLRVEQVHVGRSPALPEHDHPFRPGGEVGQARQPRLTPGSIGPARGPAPMSDARAAMPTPLAAEPNNWRRVTRAIFSRRRSSMLHSRVNASSRFRIARQTAESAAWSRASSVRVAPGLAHAEECPRPRAILRVNLDLPGVGATEDPEVEIRRLAAHHELEGVGQSAIEVVRCSHASLGQDPRGLDPGRVVERGERVEGRAGRAGPHAAGLAVCGVEHVGRRDGPSPERVEAAAVEVLSRGGRVREVPFLGDGERLPDGVGLVGIDGAAADPQVDQAARTRAPSLGGSRTASGIGSPANTAGFPGRGRADRASRDSTAGRSRS